MGKTWVLDTGTKGTGANVVPFEKAQEKEREPRRASRPAKAASERSRQAKPGSDHPSRPVPAGATPLPPGHVRKKATGEIGKVRAVDARAGTATVQWLKRGATSTVPLSSISRR